MSVLDNSDCPNTSISITKMHTKAHLTQVSPRSLYKTSRCPQSLYIAVSTLWGKAFVKVKTNRQLFEYSVIVDIQNKRKFVLPCSLDSTLPKESPLPLQLFCQGQANNLQEGANHSNIDGSRMNVQRDLARVVCFQSRLHSLKYL